MTPDLRAQRALTALDGLEELLAHGPLVQLLRFNDALELRAVGGALAKRKHVVGTHLLGVIERATDITPMKTCCRCRRLLCAEEFGKSDRTQDGLWFYCLKCERQRRHDRKASALIENRPLEN